MKYGLHHGTWMGECTAETLRRCVEQAKALGAETFEVRPPDYVLFCQKEEIREMRRWVEDSGVEMLFTFRYPDGMDMASPDPAVRRQAIEYLKRAIEGVSCAGGHEIGGIVYSTWPHHFDDDRILPQTKYERTQRSITCMREAAQTAESCGVQLNVELLNRFEHYMLNSVAEGLEYCRQVESSAVGLLLDVFHMNIEEDCIEDSILSAAGKIGHVHVSEPNRKIPYHNERFHWDSIGKALKAANYAGTVTLEPFLLFLGDASYNSRTFRNLTEDSSMEHRCQLMRQGLQFIKSQFEGAN